MAIAPKIYNITVIKAVKAMHHTSSAGIILTIQVTKLGNHNQLALHNLLYLVAIYFLKQTNP